MIQNEPRETPTRRDNRSRGWCFTCNNPTEESEIEVYNLQNFPTLINYVICGKEQGIEGTPHLQGYIHFKNKKSFEQVKDMFPQAHWEPSKGTSSQNRIYCIKDNDYWEFGDVPLDAKAKGQIEKERWDNAKQLAIKGDIDQIDSDIFIRCYSSICKIRTDFGPTPEDADDVTGIWIQGPAGCGKSRYAREHYTPYYTKNVNKWFCGYKNEPYVIMDDVDDINGPMLKQHIKIWLDRYMFTAETKGGAIRIRPKKFIITSQYTIRQAFQENTTIAAIERRCEIINMFQTDNINNMPLNLNVN